jgi:hypothetical protein
MEVDPIAAAPSTGKEHQPEEQVRAQIHAFPHHWTLKIAYEKQVIILDRLVTKVTEKELWLKLLTPDVTEDENFRKLRSIFDSARKFTTDTLASKESLIMQLTKMRDSCEKEGTIQTPSYLKLRQPNLNFEDPLGICSDSFKALRYEFNTNLRAAEEANRETLFRKTTEQLQILHNSLFQDKKIIEDTVSELWKSVSNNSDELEKTFEILTDRPNTYLDGEYTKIPTRESLVSTTDPILLSIHVNVSNALNKVELAKAKLQIAVELAKAFVIRQKSINIQRKCSALQHSREAGEEFLAKELELNEAIQARITVPKETDEQFQALVENIEVLESEAAVVQSTHQLYNATTGNLSQYPENFKVPVSTSIFILAFLIGYDQMSDSISKAVKERNKRLIAQSTEIDRLKNLETAAQGLSQSEASDLLVPAFRKSFEDLSRRLSQLESNMHLNQMYPASMGRLQEQQQSQRPAQQTRSDALDGERTELLFLEADQTRGILQTPSHLARLPTSANETGTEKRRRVTLDQEDSSDTLFQQRPPG